jgi:Kae1-associated kinase Bud32
LTSPGVAESFPGRLLYKGAEADVILGRWQGVDAVFKVRKPLSYRLPILDETIRRQRTLREADMTHEAKEAGVSTPSLYDVDLLRATLVMEYVRGRRLRDLIGRLSQAETKEVFTLFGAQVAKLHAAGIMHGDLTTANVVRKGEALVFLDFGLSVRTARVEDHAVDLRLIKETLVGAHSPFAPAALEAIYEGYSKVSGGPKFKAVFRQLRSIERRGRYARVT